MSTAMRRPRVLDGATFPGRKGRHGDMTTEFDAIVLGPDEGTRSRTSGTAGAAMEVTVVKASAEDTRGAYTLREREVPAGQPPVRPHIHHAMEEAFYVLDGALTFQLGRRTVTAGAGSFVLVPRGVLHTFANPGATPARALFVFSPPGFERYFEQLAALRQASATGQVDAATLTALAATYDTEYVDLPPVI